MDFLHVWWLVIHRYTRRKPLWIVPFPIIFARKAAHRTGKMMSRWPSVYGWLEHLGNLFVIDFSLFHFQGPSQLRLVSSPFQNSPFHHNQHFHAAFTYAHQTFFFSASSSAQCRMRSFVCLVWFVFPTMAYFSICSTFCNLGHCVHRFSILEGQNHKRRILFKESCKMEVCYKLFQKGIQEDAKENANQKC